LGAKDIKKGKKNENKGVIQVKSKKNKVNLLDRFYL